jgi:hypothetical protein
VQSRAVATVTVPEPPADVKDDGAFDNWTSQRVPVGAVLTEVSLDVQAVRKQMAARILAGTKRETRGHITIIRRRLMHAARQRHRERLSLEAN